MQNYSNENKAVITATGNKCGISWRGPVIAFCGRLSGQNIRRVRDMDMRTYADLVDWLTDYYDELEGAERRVGPKVDCVKVSCNGDVRFGAERLQAVKVPRSNPIFYLGGSE